MSGAFTHTDQTDAIIRAGYAANRPVREIAAELGATKNVVVGRAFRLGLSSAERWVAAVHQPRTIQSRARQSQTRRGSNPDRHRLDATVRWVNNGWSYRDTAEHLGLTYQQVVSAFHYSQRRSA